LVDFILGGMFGNGGAEGAVEFTHGTARGQQRRGRTEAGKGNADWRESARNRVNAYNTSTSVLMGHGRSASLTMDTAWCRASTQEVRRTLSSECSDRTGGLGTTRRSLQGTISSGAHGQGECVKPSGAYIHMVDKPGSACHSTALLESGGVGLIIAGRNGSL
jgi:hypothetical protein